MTTLRIAIAQTNFMVGDLAGNAQRIISTAKRARDELDAHAVVFSELALTGYPPEDLLLRPDFLSQTQQALSEIAVAIDGIDAIFGYPELHRKSLYNSAAVIRDGKLYANYRKHELPNYGVFDEKRYFTAGDSTCVFELNGVPIGITICEDVWQPGMVERSTRDGAQILFNLNASPFHIAKISEREAVLRARINASSIPIIYANQLGGQDELVFDGASFAMDADGKVIYRAPEFEETLDYLEFGRDNIVLPKQSRVTSVLEETASVYKALVMGVRDYVNKNGFRGAVLGLSGGIDSALTLALAVDALGPDCVEAVLMPSRYTADMSIEDARLEAEALRVKHVSIPIEPAFNSFLGMLEERFKGLPADTTEENIQARCRGIILMAISNKTGKILLTTGNKSEMSVGYATLYGDMAGGFAPLKDVPKMMVYRLAEFRNRISPVIPQRVIERPPSAELAPDQVDEDSLPAYANLDDILAMYIEQDKSAQEIVAAGYSQADVERTVSLVNRNEYKRRQAPPGVRITCKAFGRDRRYPITSGFGGL